MLISDDELFNLPDDPELAFVELERIIRTRTVDWVERERQNADEYYRSYISTILGAISEFKIANISENSLPNISDGSYNVYRELTHIIDGLSIQIRIRRKLKASEESIKFDIPTKSKLRHYIEQIRQIIDNSEIPSNRKDTIRQRISALENELDRDRSRFVAFWALWVESCEYLNEGVGKLENLNRILTQIGEIVGHAKNSQNNNNKLLGNNDRKRIEPPKNRKIKVKELDEDIPF